MHLDIVDILSMDDKILIQLDKPLKYYLSENYTINIGTCKPQLEDSRKLRKFEAKL